MAIEQIGEAWFNRDNNRAVSMAGFGIALYVGAVKDGTFTGFHLGCVGKRSNALRWLRGKKSLEQIITIYPEASKGVKHG